MVDVPRTPVRPRVDSRRAGWAGSVETNDAAHGGCTGTDAPASPRILLIGELDARAAEDLLDRCRLLAPGSTGRVVIDMSAVRACDPDGLGALLALHVGDAGPGLVIEGARWSQFFGLLLAAPLEDLGRVRQQVRQLVWDARRDRGVRAVT
jgi:hypothetical protein